MGRGGVRVEDRLLALSGRDELPVLEDAEVLGREVRDRIARRVLDLEVERDVARLLLGGRDRRQPERGAGRARDRAREERPSERPLRQAVEGSPKFRRRLLLPNHAASVDLFSSSRPRGLPLDDERVDDRLARRPVALEGVLGDRARHDVPLSPGRQRRLHRAIRHVPGGCRRPGTCRIARCSPRYTRKCEKCSVAKLRSTLPVGDAWSIVHSFIRRRRWLERIYTRSVIWEQGRRQVFNRWQWVSRVRNRSACRRPADADATAEDSVTSLRAIPSPTSPQKNFPHPSKVIQ